VAVYLWGGIVLVCALDESYQYLFGTSVPGSRALRVVWFDVLSALFLVQVGALVLDILGA